MRTAKQLRLWDDTEGAEQAFFTDDVGTDAGQLGHQYDGRCGVEALIGGLKGEFRIGKVP